MSESDMLLILAHYIAVKGSYDGFSLPAAVFSGVANVNDYIFTGSEWAYVGPPNVRDLPCGGHDVTVTLESLPPINVSVAGFDELLSMTFTAGAGYATNGLSETIALAFIPGEAFGVSAVGLTETLTLSFEPGVGGVLVDQPGLAATMQMLWFVESAQAAVGFTQTLALSFAPGAASIPGTWTPANITTALWLDADDSGTITLDSGAVSEWQDKSGNARHGTQSTAIRRPVVNATGINSKPTISFDGSDDRLLFPTGFLNGATAFTVAMVMRGPSQSNDAIWGPSTDFATGLELIFALVISQPTTVRINAPSKITDNAWNTNDTAAVTAITASSSATDGWRNGTSIASTTGNSALNFNGVYAMGSYANGFNAAMNMAEFIICESALGVDDRQKLEGYLAHKWGLTADLPVDHPYKIVSP
jgi:hypothetical protein